MNRKPIRLLAGAALAAASLLSSCGGAGPTPTTTVKTISSDEALPAGGRAWALDAAHYMLWAKTSPFTSLASFGENELSRTASFLNLPGSADGTVRYLRVDQPYGESVFTWIFDNSLESESSELDENGSPLKIQSASSLNFAFDLRLDLGASDAIVELYYVAGAAVASQAAASPSPLGAYRARWEGSGVLGAGAPSSTAAEYPDSFTSGGEAYAKPSNLSVTRRADGWAHVEVEGLAVMAESDGNKRMTIGFRLVNSSKASYATVLLDNLVMTFDDEPLFAPMALPELYELKGIEPAIDASWNEDSGEEALWDQAELPLSGVSSLPNWSTEETRNAQLFTVTDPGDEARKWLRVDQSYGNTGLAFHFSFPGKTKMDLAIDLKGDLFNVVATDVDSPTYASDIKTNGWFELCWLPGWIDGDTVIDDVAMKTLLGSVNPWLLKWDGSGWGPDAYSANLYDVYPANLLPAGTTVTPQDDGEWTRIEVQGIALDAAGEGSLTLKLGDVSADTNPATKLASKRVFSVCLDNLEATGY